MTFSDIEREQLQKLPFPLRRKFTVTAAQIERLPQTRFEPFAPAWQTIDWSGDRPNISPAAADAFARDAEAIRNLPEIGDAETVEELLLGGDNE